MRPRSRGGVPLLIPLLGLLFHRTLAAERRFHIAAVTVDWSYAGQGSGPTYKKVVFREYEAGFKQAKTHPSWLGLLGPTLRGQEGDVLVVTFRNMADRPCSLHPHGIAYGKQSEGSLYFDNTSLFEKEDDQVLPGQEHTYHWEVTPEVAPKEDDPPCLTYTYISHYDIVKDYNSGLIGAMLLCKAGSLDDAGDQVLFSREYVLLFGVFNETKSWYSTPDSQATHTINGFTNGTIPDLNVCAHTSVSWHLLGMSSAPELFSVHFNGQVLVHAGRRVSSVGLISGSASSGNMTATHPGQWLLSSHVSRHMEAGMHGYLNVQACAGIVAPRRRLTNKQRRQSQEWTYYIAAEEVVWDYAPNMPDYIDGEYRAKFLRGGTDRIGRKYKKAVFTQYTDEKFTNRAENKQRKMETGILGPVIRAQINDVVKVVFKNMASRPYSIYPHGLTIRKSDEGASYPEGGNQTGAVEPGQSRTYVWEVWEQDEPTPSDSRCLTRMYHSAVDTPRDIASGLIGPLLICKSQSLNKKNVQLKADKEQQAALAVFDENKSWYIEDNIRSYCEDPSRVHRDDPDFYNSNVMHSINGYVYDSGQVLGFCNGEIVTWHMSSIGGQDHIQTATFYGHSFELNDRTEDLLSLFPMTGETITMSMNNIGHWLLASLNSNEARKGLRLKFKDLECYRDYFYDYGGKADEGFSVNSWQPEDIEEIREEEKKEAEAEAEEEAKASKYAKEPDVYDYTANYAAELGLRTFGNKSQGLLDDVELLDLALFDYNDGDAVPPHGNANESRSYPSRNDTHTAPGASGTLANLSLAERVTVDGDVTMAGFFNGSLNVTRRANESADHRLDGVESKHTNGTVFETTEPDVRGDGAVESTSRTNITSEIPYVVEIPYAANQTSPSQLDVSSKQTHRGTTPCSTGSSHAENATAEESGKKSAPEVDSFTYTVPVPKPSSNNTDKEDFVLLDGSVPVEISAVGDENMVEVDHPATSKAGFLHTVSPAFLFPDEDQKALPENTTLASESDTVHAGNTACNSSCSENVNVTGLGTEIDNTHVIDNRSLSLNGTEQGNYTLFSEATSHTAVGNRTIPKTQSDNETSPGSSSLGGRWDGGTKASSVRHSDSSEEPSSEMKEHDPWPVLDRNVSSSSVLTNLSSLPSLANTSRDAGYAVDTPAGNTSLRVSGDCFAHSTPKEEKEEEDKAGSREEVVIYLKNSSKEAIVTVSLDLQKEHWAYEGAHHLVPMEIPDNMTKYTKDESKPKPRVEDGSKVGQGGEKKKPRKRKWPARSHGMKTKKRKVYKPNPRSGISPRGHMPPGFSPRGSRPITSEEDLSTKSIVIGLPRRDFNDYELYVPNMGDEPSHDVPEDSPGDDYEYVDYKDPYSRHGDMKDMDETTRYFLKMAGDNVKAYFITAEEVEWDYAGYGQRRQERTNINDKPTEFTKVVFRSYMDSLFKTPNIRGEVDEHLGLLGPIIKAEVDQTIMVVFKNLASRPYSLHAHGVSYSKQMEGLKYDDDSPHWYKLDNEVKPNGTYTYIWKVDPKFGPKGHDSRCRTWAYHSGVNPEKDINSGLVGPLLVCRKGTLVAENTSTELREFVLLFMTFDETKSWYYEKNLEKMQRKHRRQAMDPAFARSVQFPAINGIIFSLKGLRMYTNQLARWHLMNLGSPNDLHSVHFHGQTFLDKQMKDYRQGVYPLLPGGFATLEMWPSKPGLWQLETEVGDLQQRGMQTLFLVIDNSCGHPLGLNSQSVKESQITASHYTGEWRPHLARLENSGRYNAWSTDKQNGSWIQVDFQRPVVVSKVATQGAKQLLTSHYVEKFTVSYSTDKRKWTFYKGGTNRMAFTGNSDSHGIKENTFFPPLIGRFVRLYPIESNNRPTVRMEYYGCELDGCSVPLGMESGLIGDLQITASSTATSWFSGPWQPWFARLNKQGGVNAWQAKSNDMQQWLQVELKVVQKVTGIVTQGAKSMGTEMYVSAYAIEHSKDGKTWTQYREDEDDRDPKVFPANTDNNGHVKNYIYPPIFSRFLRIVPRRWQKTITMRIELLGCEFQ